VETILDLMPMATEGTLRKHLNLTEQTERELGKHASFGRGRHHIRDFECESRLGKDLNSISLALEVEPYRQRPSLTDTTAERSTIFE
jgi:hypothetical protein